jgi:hypothetical protein
MFVNETLVQPFHRSEKIPCNLSIPLQRFDEKQTRR